MTRGVTLDAGALIALDRDDRRLVVMLARAQETSARVTIPAAALAQAVRNPARQARLARLLRQPATDVWLWTAWTPSESGASSPHPGRPTWSTRMWSCARGEPGKPSRPATPTISVTWIPR